jgi:hypothetical protein
LGSGTERAIARSGKASCSLIQAGLDQCTRAHVLRQDTGPLFTVHCPLITASHPCAAGGLDELPSDPIGVIGG